MIIHPAQGQDQGEELLNDQQPIPEDQPDPAPEVLANQVQLPILQAPPENFLNFKIPADDLMEFDDDNNLMDDQQDDNQELHGQLEGLAEQQGNLGDQQADIQAPQGDLGGMVFQNNIQLGMVRTFFC
jgi:hypothetical protein